MYSNFVAFSSGAMALIGGYEPIKNQVINDVWLFDGVSWAPVSTTSDCKVAPSPASHAAAPCAYFKGVVVAGPSVLSFGGELGSKAGFVMQVCFPVLFYHQCFPNWYACNHTPFVRLRSSRAVFIHVIVLHCMCWP